jgi:hypothetical protein
MTYLHATWLLPSFARQPSSWCTRHSVLAPSRCEMSGIGNTGPRPGSPRPPPPPRYVVQAFGVFLAAGSFVQCGRH